ncbi:MAG: NAD(P)/FAD-dependent oxidoreductase, partial [Paracoccaceae bacterium]
MRFGGADLDILTVNDKPGQYPASWYAATASGPAPYAPAKGALSCDVCVIGAGFTGLSAALHLAGMGYDVVLLEAQRVGFGASGRNGGQVGTGQRLEQGALEKMLGAEHARELWDLSLGAVQLVRDLIADNKMDCGFSDGIIHADHRARLVSQSHRYAEHLQKSYGYQHIRALARGEMRELVGSDAYFGGTLDSFAGHIQPLAFAFGLARLAEKRGVRIFERSMVVELVKADPAMVRTE